MVVFKEETDMTDFADDRRPELNESGVRIPESGVSASGGDGLAARISSTSRQLEGGDRDAPPPGPTSFALRSRGQV